ncbi:hypothetical protein SCHPADRAFT_944204 [Schizopora paradoxa]|uniref:Alcohol acetyltransferase n=1 Tax=Schizopora paradoxa TaxID=27342 RepID=A0A0H2RBE9_9AGAM|nr:hypothetical protein SCHPADRAFT_944204 [Schizopora paradoxa]
MSVNAASRKVGRIERLFVTRQYLGIDTCVIVTAKYSSGGTENQRLSKDVLFPALASVVRKHAILAVRVKDERTSSPSFERLETIDFNSIVKFSESQIDNDENEFSAFLEQEFMQHIPNVGENPLWRLAVSADNVVIFAWSHVIGDGKSGLAFHRALLDALNKSSPQDTADILHDGILTTPNDVEHLPPLEELTELKPSIGTFVSTIVRLFIPPSWHGRSEWSGNKIIRSTAPETKTFVRCVFLTPEDSKRLVALSRKNNTTLTGVIYVAAVGVLSSLLSEGAKTNPALRKFKKVSTTVAISLRPIAKVSDEAIGNIVSVFDAKAKLQPIVKDEQGSVVNFPWDNASSYSKRLRAAIPNSRRLAGMLKYISNYEDLYKDSAGKKRGYGLEVSNLGAFNIGRGAVEKEEGESPPAWTIGRTCFAQDDGVHGAAFRVSVSGDPEGAVNTAVSWGDGAVDSEFAESFVREYRDVLISLSKT